MRNPKPIDPEREQVKKIYAAMRTELEQLTTRADVVLERLRKKAAKVTPLRLVKSR